MWHQRNFEVAFDIRGSTRLMSDQSSKHIDSIQQLYHLHPEFLVNFGDQQWLSEICPHTVSHQANRLHTSLNQICARPQPTWRSKPGAGLLDRACPLKRLLVVLLINVHYVCKYTYILCIYIYIHIYIYIYTCVYVDSWISSWIIHVWGLDESRRALGMRPSETRVKVNHNLGRPVGPNYSKIWWAQTQKTRTRVFRPTKKGLKHVETHQAHQGS